jgi:selenocysteine-specific elongation factor
VVLDAPLVARAGDRFVLRLPSPATTIGGGVVVDPSPPRRRARPWPSGLAEHERLRAVLHEAGEQGVAASTFPVRLGLAPADCDALVAEADWVVRAGGLCYLTSVVTSVSERQATAIARHHQEQSLDEWVPRAALRARVAVPEAIGELALLQLAERGEVEQGAGGVRRAGWTVTLSEAQRREREWLLGRLQGAAAEPPSVGELRSEREGNDPTPLLRILERERFVVQVEADRFYAADCIQYMVARLRQGMEPGRVYGPAELRELVGTSRKFLIPFLEYCDRQRITERRLDGRVLGPDVR